MKKTTAGIATASKILFVIGLVVVLIGLSQARKEAQERAEEHRKSIEEHKANEERLTNELLTVTDQKNALINANFEEKMQKEELQSRFEGLQAEIEDMKTIIKNQVATIEDQEQTIAAYMNTEPLPHTQEDIDILAAVMYAENYISGRYEMMLTGSVVINRKNSPRFPNTIKDVVFQIDGEYEQYAKRTKNIVERVLKGEETIPSECYDLAEILLKYGSIAPQNVLYQAHFNQGKVFWEWQGEEFCFGR